MAGYGTYPAPRTCPSCGRSWTQLVDRATRQRRRTATCPSCQAPANLADRRAAPPATAVPTGDWVEQANCASTDPEIFFPEPGASVTSALTVCSRCPVIDQCRAWALETREPHGIWGGLTPNQRHTLLRTTA